MATPLTVIGDLSTIVHRDLCDMGGACGQIVVCLETAGRAIGDAFEGNRDEQHAKRWALANLHEARGRLDALIGEIEREGC